MKLFMPDITMYIKFKLARNKFEFKRSCFALVQLERKKKV